MIFATLACFLVGGSDNSLSIEEAERMAIEHSTEVRLAKDSLKSAWAQAGQISAKSNPQLGIAGSATRFDDKTTVGFAGASFEVLSDHTEEATLQLVQVIDVTNQLGTAHAQARMAALAQEYAVRSRISDQILATKIAFVNALRAGEGVRVAQSTLDAYREQLRITTELWKQGTGQRIDVYRATSQVANAEKDLVERQNDLDMARSVLNDEIGVQLDSNMSLEDVRESISKDGRRDSDRSETLIELAKRQRSESKSAALGVIAAQKGIKLARSSSDPTVLLALSGSYFPTTSFTYPRQSVGVLTLSVNIPIFDGGEARARVEEARATLDTVKTQEQQVQRAIALQVQNAWDGVLSARKSLQAAITSLTAAISARNLAGQRFENQVGLYLEVTDSQAALSAAQASQINAAYDLLIADAQLQRATGDLTLSAQENRIK